MQKEKSLADRIKGFALVVKRTDKMKMRKAMEVQNKIREKTKGGKDSAKEIRKWRERNAPRP